MIIFKKIVMKNYRYLDKKVSKKMIKSKQKFQLKRKIKQHNHKIYRLVMGNKWALDLKQIKFKFKSNFV